MVYMWVSIPSSGQRMSDSLDSFSVLGVIVESWGQEDAIV